MLPEDEDGFAISSADLLSDFLCEHQCDEDEGPPEEWPEWTDDQVVGIGPAFTREESFDGQLPLTDEEDLVLLRQVERTDWERWLAGPAESQP